MFFSPTNAPVWESADAQRLKEFLESTSGQRLVSNLCDQIPALLDGGDVNKTLVASGEVKGWNACVGAIFLLLTVQPPQPKAPETYPNLDDDRNWEKPDTTTTPTR